MGVVEDMSGNEGLASCGRHRHEWKRVCTSCCR